MGVIYLVTEYDLVLSRGLHLKRLKFILFPLKHTFNTREVG